MKLKINKSTGEVAYTTITKSEQLEKGWEFTSEKSLGPRGISLRRLRRELETIKDAILETKDFIKYNPYPEDFQAGMRNGLAELYQDQQQAKEEYAANLGGAQWMAKHHPLLEV